MGTVAVKMHSPDRCVIVLLAILGAADASHHRLHNHVDRVLRKLHSVVPEATSNATTHFYNDAVLDHFLASVASPKAPKWSQRYYIDQTHWCGAGCPVFLYIGGEGPQGPPSSRLFMSTLAAEAGAMTVALERRFFGESYPTADMSDHNLEYLTSSQALADLARFIEYLKSDASPDTSSEPPLQLRASASSSKFVTFGGSYPGNLAAWFKLKYPSLTVGSVASSAPVFAEYDFEQYAQVVGNALGNPGIGGSKDCADKITQGVDALQSLVTIGGCDGNQRPDGCPCSHKWDCKSENCSVAASQPSSNPTCGAVAPVPHALRPCTSPTSALDVAQYQSSVFSQFQGVVQYNEETAGPSVNSTCAAVVAEHSGLAALAAGVAHSEGLSAGDQSAPCISSDFEKDTVEAVLANTSFSGRGCGLSCTSSRQWIFMSCNEFGYFQTTTGANQPFKGFGAVGIEFAGYQTCKAAFNVSDDYKGPKRNSDELLANTEYGARALEGINITIPNGSMDPWHALAIVNQTDEFFSNTQHLSQREQVVFIKDTAHCRDMYSPGAFEGIGIKDTEAVQWAHSKIRADVLGYLQ